MRICDLPPPPRGRTGWPWDVQQVPAYSEPADWPRITIVTPSLNQGCYLEEAIRSVLCQGYPNVEYVVVDGGSHDETIGVLERYAPFLAATIREADQGQADALKKGFSGATGSLLAWLNADDAYLPGALHAVGDRHRVDPTALLAGDVVQHNETTGEERVVPAAELSLEARVRYWEGRGSLQQPGLFFPREAFDAAGGLDTHLRYAMDLDLLCRLLARHTPVSYLGHPVARFRLHPHSKTCAEGVGMILETAVVANRYVPAVPGVDQSKHRAFVSRALLGVAWRRLQQGRPLSALALVCRGTWISPVASLAAFRRWAGARREAEASRGGP